MSLVGAVVKRRFEIIGLLGEGGQGETYIALDRESDREVAIKFQFDRSFESTQLYSRLAKSMATETRISRSLIGVPGIPRTITGGNHHGRVFMVMDLVDGPNLSTLIHTMRPLVLSVVASIICQLCETLEVVHSRGFVHRDVKPDNIIQPYGRRLHLLDLGLATRIGALVKHPAGTLGYSPPEQFKRGARLTPRADIFALGSLLFEMCVMERPYAKGDKRPWLTEEVLPQEVLDDVPRDILPLALRMVAQNPDDRPESMREVFECLSPSLPTPGSTRHPKTPHPDPTLFYRQVRPDRSL